jgi:Mn-dependent DtxR family transcriptional regulator
VTGNSTEEPYRVCAISQYYFSMHSQTVRDGLLVTLALRYEEDPSQFVVLSKHTVDSSSARVAVAELRNAGFVEEQVRGVIRLTARGYKMYKTMPVPWAFAG